MASNLKVALATATAEANALAVLCNGGFLDIYATAQPANPETAAGGSSLVSFNLAATFAASVTSGVITANAIASATIANSGTAAWFRVTKSDHTTPVFDGSVGTASADLIIGSTALAAGASAAISSFTFTVPGV